MGPFGSEVKTFSGLQRGRQSIRVPILEDLNRSGGVMQVELGMLCAFRFSIRIEIWIMISKDDGC